MLLLVVLLLFGCLTNKGQCGNKTCDINESNSLSVNYCPNDCAAFVSSDLNVPYSFLAIHEETWDGLEELMNLAITYNTKVTIMFWPGEVRKVLDDPVKLQKVKEWYLAGNEIGLHNQGCYGAVDCGTDADLCHQESDKANYEKLAQLTGQGPIKSGTSVCPKWMPDGYSYTVESRTGGYVPAYIGIDDGRTAKVLVREASMGATGDYMPTEDNLNKILYRIHGKAGYGNNKESATPQKIVQYNTLNSTEIYGFILHTADFQQYNEPLKEWLQFLYAQEPTGQKRKTVSEIMEEYVLPQNFVYAKTCGNLICDYSERINNSCRQDCGECANTSKGISCDCDMGGNSLDRPCVGNPTQIYFYFAKGILITCGDNNCQEGETTTSCPVDCGGEVKYYCGDNLCREKDGENTITCPIDCSNAHSASVCGDGICDGVAGEKENCPEDCIAPNDSCGNGVCDNKETTSSCPADCLSGDADACGDGVCDGEAGEKTTCPEDCIAPIK